MSRSDPCQKCKVCMKRSLCPNWVPKDENIGALAMSIEPNTDESLLNEHGKYVLRYAKNHGISIAEAHKAPIVQAHLDFFSSDVGQEMFK